MQVVLQEINEHNWKILGNLKPNPEFEPLTVPNWQAMLEASQRGFTALGIQVNGVWAGLCMYGLDPVENTYWLYHYMLSEQFQGKGLGVEVLSHIIETIRTMPNCYQISVAVAPENVAGYKVLTRAGFIHTYETRANLLVLRLPTTPLAPTQVVQVKSTEKKEINWERVLLSLIFFLLVLYGTFNVIIPQQNVNINPLG